MALARLAKREVCGLPAGHSRAKPDPAMSFAHFAQSVVCFEDDEGGGEVRFAAVAVSASLSFHPLAKEAQERERAAFLNSGRAL